MTSRHVVKGTQMQGIELIAGAAAFVAIRLQPDAAKAAQAVADAVAWAARGGGAAEHQDPGPGDMVWGAASAASLRRKARRARAAAAVPANTAGSTGKTDASSSDESLGTETTTAASSAEGRIVAGLRARRQALRKAGVSCKMRTQDAEVLCLQRQLRSAQGSESGVTDDGAAADPDKLEQGCADEGGAQVGGAHATLSPGVQEKAQKAATAADLDKLEELERALSREVAKTIIARGKMQYPTADAELAVVQAREAHMLSVVDVVRARESLE